MVYLDVTIFHSIKKQYEILGKTLTLKVKKPAIFLRVLFFFMSGVILLGPAIGILILIANREPFHFKYLFGGAINVILGLYILRYTLWNVYGKEILTFNKNEVTHTIDYKLYKRSSTQHFEGRPQFTYRYVGYEEDKVGALVIVYEDDGISTAAKVPIDQLEHLIAEIKTVIK